MKKTRYNEMTETEKYHWKKNASAMVTVIAFLLFALITAIRSWIN